LLPASAPGLGFVDFPSRLVQIAVQSTAFFIGEALWTLLLPLKTVGLAGIPLAWCTPVMTIGTLLRRAQLAPRPGGSRPCLQDCRCQKKNSQMNAPPAFHAPYSIE